MSKEKADYIKQKIIKKAVLNPIKKYRDKVNKRLDNQQTLKLQDKRRAHIKKRNVLQQQAANRKRKRNSGITGYTTDDGGHTHAFTILPNNDVIIHIARHPKTDKIQHTHKYIGKYPDGYITEEKSACYPECKQKYGYAGVGSHNHRIINKEDFLPNDLVKSNMRKLKQKEKDLLLANLNTIEKMIDRSSSKIDLNDKKFSNFALKQLIQSNQINYLAALIYKIGLPNTKGSIKFLLKLLINNKHRSLIEYDFKRISNISISNFLKTEIKEDKLSIANFITTYVAGKILYVYLSNYKF